ncbi:hypothetical protein Taro_014119 [Colocasia esculenta]|uniref:Beta-glucosidase n=1 Tax=Colocasia esculenta TaxID=4460 RepID=A0A843UHE8_COLES|nr:hypothetical protein [Colocasia esculenta]
MAAASHATAVAANGDGGAQAAVYRDPEAPVEARIRDLLARMTLREKAAQMAQINLSVASPYALSTLAVGSVLNAAGSSPGQLPTPADWADMVDDFQRWALSSRLGVPMLYATDAVHGHNNLYGATVFPHNVGLGAARDPDLVRRIGEVTALEVRATGMPCTFAPCVAVCRDPRWGRCYESYSEDTGVVCTLGSSIVAGLQGTPPPVHRPGDPYLAGLRNVLACAKHFVGDGGTDQGVNEGDTICSFGDLESVHMKPYVDCLAQGVSLVMATYSSWNGSRVHSDRFLITEVLKGKLGFKGIVISDWEGIDRLCQPQGSDYRYCISASINAGLDMIMVPFGYEKFLEDLLFLVESGDIPMARIDDAVERILRVKFVAGLFEHPFSDRSLIDIVGCKAHRQLAREAVRKSLVLLKNGKDPKRPFLPLDKNAKKVLVAGTHADDIGYQCGGWTLTWDGGKGKITVGIVAHLGPMWGPPPPPTRVAGASPTQQAGRASAQGALAGGHLTSAQGALARATAATQQLRQPHPPAASRGRAASFSLLSLPPLFLSPYKYPFGGTTILEGIKAAVGKNTEVIYKEFPTAATFADQEYSYAVVVVGEGTYAESLGDRTDLQFPFNGAETILSIAQRVPTLVIIVSGRPLILEPEVMDSIDALVAAWLPGTEGEGVADVVFGDYDFEGVLPVTWLRRMDQLPMNANHELHDPLFPLGFGLRMEMGNISRHQC